MVENGKDMIRSLPRRLTSDALYDTSRSNVIMMGNAPSHGCVTSVDTPCCWTTPTSSWRDRVRADMAGPSGRYHSSSVMRQSHDSKYDATLSSAYSV